MSLIKYLLTEIAQTGSITVYHATNDPEQSFKKNNKIFTSTSKKFVLSYGDNIFELTINPKNTFYSTDVKDIEKLYKKGFLLGDPYLDSEIDMYPNIKDHYVIDNYEGYYPSAEDFIKGTEMMGNTWEPIERTRGVVDWIERNNYDCIYLLEDGAETYFILDMSIIKSIKEIE